MTLSLEEQMRMAAGYSEREGGEPEPVKEEVKPTPVTQTTVTTEYVTPATVEQKEEPKIIKDPNKVVKSPVTVADYQHNITVRENELKILNAKKEEILKKYDNEYYKQNSNNKLLENYTAERYKIEDKIRDTKKEIKIQQKKKEDQLTKEIVTNSKEEKNERSVATELNGIRTY